ncbi:low molecular weight phosphotyrosine protein phosphatase [Solihabitans fulvus]|uniref:protein-tyrosine-phosphatase n=1 Tax=Solihabitans fulvus TaxID=1892852 RepID=A0A5B2XLK9_9PSEU|nr:low molecular weight protein-tyrosine-phosphatase [Solihabitans fulvus]KAA2263830.1 low molecular weight phosphotyrosine protein phosphatase [Solihabitans fulvus]
MHVTFVCTGNICRSPMAALVFGEHLRRAGLADLVTVTSAGTGGWHVGEPADERAAKVLADHGYPTGHAAAKVGQRHLAADLLVAMDRGHERALLRMVNDPARVRLLRSFDPAAGDDLDVPDPYYDGIEDFREVLAMVEAATPGMLDWVREHL